MKLIGDNLTCIRGGRTVFEHLSFALGDGESLVLTGPNGAGKSSLLRVIAGLVATAAGTLRLEGSDPELSIGQHCHFIGHANALKGALTVAENIDFWSRYLGLSGEPASLEPFGLDGRGAIPAELLSSGQGRRLALTRLAAVSRPLWLLDEPSVGVDAASQEILVRHMKAHLEDGGMIVAATHVDLGLAFTHALDVGAFRAAS